LAENTRRAFHRATGIRAASFSLDSAEWFIAEQEPITAGFCPAVMRQHPPGGAPLWMACWNSRRL